MRKETTNNELMLILQDLEAQVASHPTFYLFNRDKINHFYAINKKEIRTFQETVQGFYKDYAAHGEDGNPVMTMLDGRPAVVFRDPEAKEAFVAAQAAFLALKINLTV